MNNNRFEFFSNCILVNGYKRSIIVDLQLGRYKYLPKEFIEILEKYGDKTIGAIKEILKNEQDKGLDLFFNYFVENGWAFFSDSPEKLPSLSLDWDFPGDISNAIIDIEEETPHYLEKTLKELDKLGCRALQIRFFSSFNLIQIVELNKLLNQLNFGYIEVYSLFDETLLLDLNRFNDLFWIDSFHFYSAPENKIKILKAENGVVRNKLVFHMEALNLHNCGFVNKDIFSPTMSLFTESQKYNSCLNRKVGIDVLGNIKNCPTMATSFGNIKTDTIKSALMKKEFTDVWHINKSKIEVCSDCEFRYICTDCRANIVDGANIYSKPSGCKYNPYTATWEEE